MPVGGRQAGRAQVVAERSLEWCCCALSTEATQTVSQLITETEPKGRHVPSLSGHLLCELSDLLFQ